MADVHLAKRVSQVKVGHIMRPTFILMELMLAVDNRARVNMLIHFSQDLKQDLIKQYSKFHVSFRLSSDSIYSKTLFQIHPVPRFLKHMLLNQAVKLTALELLMPHKVLNQAINLVKACPTALEPRMLPKVHIMHQMVNLIKVQFSQDLKLVAAVILRAADSHRMVIRAVVKT